MERYRQIQGFEDYMVSDKGRVWSRKSNKILSPGKNTFGYLHVFLYKNGKQFPKKVHRLIATHFIPNPEGLPEVHHKNEIKTDNRLENLQWVSRQYNNEYSKAGYYVLYDKNDNKIEIYNLVKFARENGLNFQGLFDVAKGKLNSYYGYTREKGTKLNKKGSFRLVSPAGEVVTFENQMEAANSINARQPHIFKLLKGEVKVCKGWTLP